MQDSIKVDFEPILFKIDSLTIEISKTYQTIQDSQNLIVEELEKIGGSVDLLNTIEILISAFVGILTGLIASYIFASRSKRLELNRLQKQFEPLVGDFIRWWQDDKVKGNKREFVIASIKYLIKNRLLIEVKTLIGYSGNSSGVDYQPDQIELWTGEIVMDTERSGTIVWEQRNPDNGNNGFKRIIVEKELKGITLVGESDKGFGIERFTERKKTTANN